MCIGESILQCKRNGSSPPNGWIRKCQIVDPTGRSANGFDKKVKSQAGNWPSLKARCETKQKRDIVDTNLHAHAEATAFGLWEAPICTIRRSEFLGELIRTL
jgi:hypothetical protein